MTSQRAETVNSHILQQYDNFLLTCPARFVSQAALQRSLLSSHRHYKYIRRVWNLTICLPLVFVSSLCQRSVYGPTAVQSCCCCCCCHFTFSQTNPSLKTCATNHATFITIKPHQLNLQ